MSIFEQQNKLAVKRFGEVYAGKSLDSVDDLLAPDFVRHCQATPWIQVNSREDFKRFLQEDWNAVPDGKLTPIRLVAEDDCVAMFGVYTGTQMGEWGPLPPSGKQFQLDCCGMFRLAGGRIEELWITWDNVALMRQLGYWPPPQAE